MLSWIKADKRVVVSVVNLMVVLTSVVELEMIGII